MSGSKFIAVILGALLALVGLGLTMCALALAIINGTQTNSDGFFVTEQHRLQSATAAITTQRLDLEAEPDLTQALGIKQAVLRLEVAPDDPGRTTFVGIAPTSEVDAYLSGVPHDVITDVQQDPFRVSYDRHEGAESATPPGSSDIWVATATNPEKEILDWEPRSGDWTVVLMNADGSRGVGADVSVGVKLDSLAPFMATMLMTGLLLIVGAIALLVVGLSGSGGPGTPPATATSPAGPADTPVRLSGQLDPALSQWMWLVKWLLAIPHYLVLIVLWAAFAVLTLVAGIAILFTGRYPRGIFDFNVGVLRWSWRVSYYANGVLATDKYPPFSMAAQDYPAQLEIAYPERLSRPLVLVKWWLLAIPHYVVIAFFSGGWSAAADSTSRYWIGGSLIGVLVLIAGISLLFTFNYPRGIFDLVMGLQRWLYRVTAYVALMTDQYPPFRLDQGGTEPTGPTTGSDQPDQPKVLVS